MQGQHGVTLIELMVTLSITVIVLAIAVPSFRTSLTENRLAGVSYEFMGALNLARSEAVKRGRNVVLCKRANDNACAVGSNWSNGWIAYADNNANGALDAGERLRVWGALDASDSAVSDNAADSIQYARNGIANLTGTFVFCHNSEENRARAVVVTLTRPRFAGDTNDPRDGIPNKENGNNITNCEAP